MIGSTRSCGVIESFKLKSNAVPSVHVFNEKVLNIDQLISAKKWHKWANFALKTIKNSHLSANLCISKNI